MEGSGQIDPALTLESSRKVAELEGQLLSRLAAILGHAVPAHRFSMVEYSVDGAEISKLSDHERLIERWRTRFTTFSFKVVPLGSLEPNNFPLIWVPNADGNPLLVRGQVSNRLIAEDATGAKSDISLKEAAAGELIVLRENGISEAAGLQKNRSASEWFASAVRAHRGIFAEAILATFLISLIGLASAMYTMQVYDRVVPTKGYSTLMVLTVGVAIAMALELISKQVRAHMVDKACKAIDQDLSAVFFGKALDIRLDARPKTVGTFASQIRHFESVRNFMTSSTLFIFADAPFALFFVGVIAIIGGPVALVPLVILPLSFLVGMFFRKPIETYTSLHMEESNRKNGLLIEAIDGIESVKSVNGEWKLLDRWRELTGLISRSELKMRGLQTLSTNMTQTMQQVSYVGMITVGAYLITVGEITMGALIACSIIGGRALAPLAQIPNLIVQWKQAKIALDVLDNIMAMPGERDAEVRLVIPEVCSGELRAEDLKFGYYEEIAAVQVPKLQLKAGERVAVLGSIGSGKSSLIKLLAGLYKPQHGRVFLDGVDVSLIAPEYVREHTGYLPQDVRLFNGTLRDNLVLGLPSPSDAQILDACKLTGLDRVVQSNPKGLELEISEGGRGLSGGQRQLVGLTRMLLLKPSVLFLDEPTASMDAQTEIQVMRHLFGEMPKSSTLVVVTHKIGILPHVDRVIVMDKGKIVLDGPRDKVMEMLKQTDSGSANTVKTQPQTKASSVGSTSGWTTVLKNDQGSVS